MHKKFNEFNEASRGTFWDWLTGKKTSGNPAEAEQGKPSGMAESDVDKFYQELEEFANSGKSIAVQSSGTMAYSKLVEDIQIALMFLGYPLPKFGVDGLFGPETATAIRKFNETTGRTDQMIAESIRNFSGFLAINEAALVESNPLGTTVIDSDLIKRLVLNLKNRNFSQEDLNKFTRKVGVTLTSTEDDEFYKAVLKGLGANETPEKIKFLKAWRQGEGGKARNNPFNTTKKVHVAGLSNYNSVGVKNYPDRQTGLYATIATIKLPYYRRLLNLLRNDSVTAQELAACRDLHTWGTGDNVSKVLASGRVNPPPIYA